MLLYHGTSAKYLDSILEHGLVPRGENGTNNWEHTVGSNPDTVYLSNNYPVYFAMNAMEKNDSALVVEIDTDLEDFLILVPDEDVLEQVTREIDREDLPEELRCPPAIQGMEKRTIWFRDKALDLSHYWEKSLEIMGTCGAYGGVTIEAITRYVIIEPRAPIFAMTDPTITPLNNEIMGGYYRNLVRGLFRDPLHLDEVVSDFHREHLEKVRDHITEKTTLYFREWS